MQNIKTEVKDNILTITVDLTKRFGRSASGKTIIIASSQGNQSLPDNPDIKIGLNIYTK